MAKSRQKHRQNRPKIFSLSFALFLFSVSFALGESAQAASLYLFPSSGSCNIGQTFSVGVYVSSTDQAMNASSGIISFPRDKLEVVSLSKSGSIINLWVQEPAFFNGVGTANFEGIVLNPGYRGSSGKIIVLNFKAKAAGNASLIFTSGSVLANDGKGTNILTAMGSGTYVIQEGGEVLEPSEEYTPPPTPAGVPSAPVISSSTHLEEEKWHSNNDPEFSWKLPSDVTGVSLLFDKNTTSNPGSVSDGLMESKKYKDVEDGIWYFHIKFRNQNGWGKITHRKVLIDTVAPEPFEIEVKREDFTDPRPILLFESTDKTSGVEEYEIRIGEGDVFSLPVEYVKNNPYKIPPQAPGKRLITIKALDKADNFSFASTEIDILPLEAPIISKYPQRLTLGEPLILEGESLPGVNVLVFITEKGKNLANEEATKADEDGKWLLVYPKLLAKGSYLLWAKAQDERGSLSFASETKSFKVGLPALFKFGKIAIDYLTLMTTLIVLIVGAVLIIFYGWYRISLWRKRVRKETKEVGESVQRAFRALREEVQEQIEHLDKKAGLSKSEKQVRDKLKEALDISEEFISKEIKDVEKEFE